MSATVLLFARYDEHYVSVSRAFPAHTINFIPSTAFALVYNCATTLVSFKLIKLSLSKKTALSIKIEDMIHELQVSMGGHLVL